MKKLLKKIQAYLHRPKYIVTDPLAHPCVVKEVEANAKSFAEALGISMQRELQLEKWSHDLMEQGKSMAEVAASVSLQCNHANELALVGYHLGNCPAIQFLNRHNMLKSQA